MQEPSRSPRAGLAVTTHYLSHRPVRNPGSQASRWRLRWGDIQLRAQGTGGWLARVSGKSGLPPVLTLSEGGLAKAPVPRAPAEVKALRLPWSAAGSLRCLPLGVAL